MPNQLLIVGPRHLAAGEEVVPFELGSRAIILATTSLWSNRCGDIQPAI